MNHKNFSLLLICLVICPLAASAQWIKHSVNTTASFRGLSVVSERVIWASGTGGTVIRTIDGGARWDVIAVPGAEKLDFRDIEAFDGKTAYILSIGNGDSSRIYKTIDGGKTWNISFQNHSEPTFYDALACWDRDHCIAMADPVDGNFWLIKTNDGGKVWSPAATFKPASALPGEAAFAASGTCLIAQGKSNAFLVSGGSAARVFRSTDRGVNWTVTDTPIIHGSAGSGIFSIAMFDDKNGVIVGGNYEKPDDQTNNIAFTKEGGVSWIAASGLSGYRSAVIYVNELVLFAVGTNGSDISVDGGKTWNRAEGGNYNAVQAKNSRSIWAVGQKGLVAKFKISKEFHLN